MNKIYLVRHGENIANITKEFSYKKVDYSLTEKGKLQAFQTAEYFKNIQIDSIYSSPLKRALETARIISEVIKQPFSINENFRELNVGKLEEMKPTKEAWEIFYDVTNEWLNGNGKVSFPEGESLNTLTARFKNGLIDINDKIKDKVIIVVGHGGIFTNGIIELLNITNKKGFYDQDNHNCSITELDIDVENKEIIKLELIKWASVEHLSGKAAIFVNGLLDSN